MTEAEDAQFAAEIAAVAREFGETNSVVADKHFEFGSLLANRPGEEKRAICQFESCLSIQRANFGDMTLSVAVTLQKLGKLHNTMGNFKKALSAYYASLERYAHLFGKDTEQISDLLRDIAAVYQTLNRDDAKQSLLEKADLLDETMNTGAGKTQYFVEIYADLADVVAKSGNYAESDGLYRTCIQLAAHHQSGREAARYNFKYAKQLEGRFEQDMAEQYFYAAAELSINYPELCLMTAECKYFLGHAAKDQHRLTDATKYLEEAMELWKKHLGEKNPLVGKCFLKIAQVLRLSEEYEKAIYFHEKSIEILSACSRTPPANPEDYDKIPGLKEASSVDFLVHAKGELGITLQRHSADEGRRGNSLVMDAVSHLQGKRYSPEHPLVSTLIAAKRGWTGGDDSSYNPDVSIDLTVGTASMLETSDRDNAPGEDGEILVRTMSDLSRPATGSYLETGNSTPVIIIEHGEQMNEFSQSHFKELYGSTGGSIGATGEAKTVPEMVDSLLSQAGDMLSEGRYVPTDHTLMNCYNAAKMGLPLTDPVSGVRITDNVILLSRITLAAAESARRVGHFEIAKNAYHDVMSTRGISYENPAKAALNIQRSPFSDEKIGDIEILLGYISLLLDQESFVAIGDALDVISEVMKDLVANKNVDIFQEQQSDAKPGSGHGPRAKALSRAGMLYVRVLQTAATYHLSCGRLVTSCEYLSRGTELCKGADQATSQLTSLLRIGGVNSDSMYSDHRRVFLGEFDIIECNFYLAKAAVYIALKDFQNAVECSKIFQATLQALSISTSHPIVASFELLATELSLCDGNVADAYSHNKKAFSIYSLTFLEDHPCLADALFKQAEISRIEGKEHRASSTYGTVLEMMCRLRGQGTISEAIVQAAQAANILSNTAPSPTEFAEAIDLLRAARNKLVKRLPYETHYLILSVDLQVLNAFRMQTCGLYALDLTDPDRYIMSTHELEVSYDRIFLVAKDFFDADYRSIPSTLYADIIKGRAQLLEYLGNYSDAESLYGTATDLLRDTYGSDEYAPVSDSMMDNAMVHWKRGRMFHNLGGIVSADVEHKARTYGKQHHVLADSLESLGRIFTDYGHFSVDYYTRAQQVLVQAAVIRSHVFGVGSLPVASIEDALGVFYTRKLKHDDAIAYLNRSLGVRVQHLGEGHRLVGESHAHLALAYWNIGDIKLCKEHAQKYYDNTNGALAGSHPMVLIASGFYSKVRLAEIKTRVVKVTSEEKDEIEKTYKNCREILMYGCGFERHTWWLMFLCGAKIASPSSTWYELSPTEMDDTSTQFKLGSATANSIAGRLVRADTATNLLQEKHENLIAERNLLLEKFKEYETTMKIGDVMALAAKNKELNDEINDLREKVSTAGSLLVEKDVAELDLMTLYKMQRQEEELHKSELSRLRGAVSIEENKESLVRLPDSALGIRMDENSIFEMIDEKKHMKDLLISIDDKNDGLLKTRKALADELGVIDIGITKETDFLLSADNDRNELLLQIGAGNVTTLKLATRLGKRKHDMAPSAAIEEAVEICRSTFEEVVSELNRCTEKDSAIETAEIDIVKLKRDIESHNYDLETEMKNMSKRQIAETKAALAKAEEGLKKREENIIRWRDERIVLSSHVVLLKCKLRDAQQLLFILKGVAVGKYESQYEYASALWDRLYAVCKERDSIQGVIDNFNDIDTEKSLNQLAADLDVVISKVKRQLDELRAIELQVPIDHQDDESSVVFEDDIAFREGSSAETDSAHVQAAKDNVADKEAKVSTLWANVLGSLSEQEELKKNIADVQIQIGSNEIKMRNLRQSVKLGGKSPSMRMESSASANPKSMGEVNLILSEAEGRKEELKEKTAALNSLLISICERENLGTLVKSMDPAVVAESYSKDLETKLRQLESDHENITKEVTQNKADIGSASKDLHVLEVEISRVEGASKQSTFQSRDPEVTRLVSILKAKEISSIDEVEAEQQAFIDVGIIHEREEKLRNDLAVARMEIQKTPSGSSNENKSRLVGLRHDKKLLTEDLNRASVVRDEKKHAYVTAKKDREAVNGDVQMISTNNERAASPLLKERGAAALELLGKMKSFTDIRVDELKAEVAEEEDKVYHLLTAIDEVNHAIDVIEEEIAQVSYGDDKDNSLEEALKAKVLDLERRYNVAIADHAAAEESLTVLKAKVEATNNETHELRQRIQEMVAKEKADLIGEGGNLPGLIADRDALSERMTQLTTTLSENQVKEKQLDANVKDSRAKYIEVTTALVDAVKTSELAKTTETDLKLLRGRSMKMERELSTKIVNESPQDTMKAVQMEIDRLSEEEQKYLDKLEAVDRKIDTEQAALTKAVEASRLAKKGLDAAEHKFNESHIMEQESIVAVRQLEDELKVLEGNIAIEAENLHALRVQRRQLSDQLNKVDIEVVAVNGEKQRLLSKSEPIGPHEIDLCQSRKARIATEIEILRVWVHNDEQRRMLEFHPSVKKQLETDLREAKDFTVLGLMSMADSCKLNEKKLADVHKDLDARNKQLEDMKVTMQEMRRTISKHGDETNLLEIQIEKLNAAISKAHKTVQSRDETIMKKKSNIEKLKQDLVELPAWEGKLAASQQKVSEQAEYIEELTSKLRQKEEDVADLNKAAEERLDASKKIEAAMKDLSKEKLALQNNLSRKTQECERTTEMIENMQSDYDAAQAKVVNLESSLSRNEKERSRLSGELSRSEDQVAALKKQIIPLEIKEKHQYEEIEMHKHHIERLDEELKSVMGMRKSLDPWGFGKEAEAGFSRFATIRNIVEPESLGNSWGKDHESKESLHLQKRAQMDPLQPSVSAFDQLNQGAAPVKIFGGVRSLKVADNIAKSSGRDDKPCQHCGRYANDSRGGVGISRRATSRDMFLSDHMGQQSPPDSAAHAVPASQGNSPRTEKIPVAEPTPTTDDSFGQQRSRAGKPTGLFPALDGNIRPGSAGGSKAGGKPKRVKKSFPDKFSKSTPSQLHAAFGGEPFGELMGNNSPNQSVGDVSGYGTLVSPEPRERRLKEHSVGSLSTSKTSKL